MVAKNLPIFYVIVTNFIFVFVITNKLQMVRYKKSQRYFNLLIEGYFDIS